MIQLGGHLGHHTNRLIVCVFFCGGPSGGHVELIPPEVNHQGIEQCALGQADTKWCLTVKQQRQEHQQRQASFLPFVIIIDSFQPQWMEVLVQWQAEMLLHRKIKQRCC